MLDIDWKLEVVKESGWKIIELVAGYFVQLDIWYAWTLLDPFAICFALYTTFKWFIMFESLPLFSQVQYYSKKYIGADFQ